MFVSKRERERGRKKEMEIEKREIERHFKRIRQGARGKIMCVSDIVCVSEKGRECVRDKRKRSECV